MENNTNQTPESQETQQGTQNLYTDPNAGMNQAQYTDANAGMNQAQYGYQQSGQNYNTNYQQQYQDNYNYNVNSSAAYNQDNTGFDTTPLSMGEWVLTILIMGIPCVNIVMLFVWAFGKSGNLNRRNFCRAELIFMAIGAVLAVIVGVIVAVAGIGASTYYY